MKMLREEAAAQEKIPSLAEKFYQDYIFLVKEERKKRKNNAERNVIIGSVFLGCGVFLSLVTYLAAGGSFLVFYGAIIIGLGMLVWGLVEKSNLKS